MSEHVEGERLENDPCVAYEDEHAAFELELAQMKQTQLASARPQKMVDGIPRRMRIDCMTRGELAILQAIQEVELTGCDPMLTDTINILHDAQDKIGDWADLEMEKREMEKKEQERQ